MKIRHPSPSTLPARPARATTAKATPRPINKPAATPNRRTANGASRSAPICRAKGAETQLKQVQRHARDPGRPAKSAIVQLDVRGETFYRVRFGAFTPAKAESLCEKLQKRGTSCLVVTDGAWDQANARASLPIAVR